MTLLDQLAFRGAAERELIVWDNNGALLRPELVAVLDFYFAGVRPRVDDLALPLCYLAQAGVGLTELRELVDAYDSGGAAPPSRDERRALPFAMAGWRSSCSTFCCRAMGRTTRMPDANSGGERGPACAWWLERLREGASTTDSFL